MQFLLRLILFRENHASTLCYMEDCVLLWFEPRKEAPENEIIRERTSTTTNNNYGGRKGEEGQQLTQKLSTFFIT